MLFQNVALKQKLNDCYERETHLMKKLALKEDEVASLKAELKFSKMQVLQGKENLELQLKECAEHHKQTVRCSVLSCLKFQVYLLLQCLTSNR